MEEVKVLNGGRFIEVGDEIDAIAFDLNLPLQRGDTLNAEAEYLGGPTQGLLQLYNVTTG
ncbi:hypothetical protein ACLQ2Q_21380 [Microbacterium sp. DT81.1]|uniref:hypothetical protein n=1 Tax=Microbacterium sp. DT81.1 TaxID=3393413 RepID=UPI003CF983C8